MNERKLFTVIQNGKRRELDMIELLASDLIEPEVRILIAVIEAESGPTGWLEGLSLKALGERMYASIPTVRLHVQSAVDRRIIEVSRQGGPQKYRLTYTVDMDASPSGGEALQEG